MNIHLLLASYAGAGSVAAATPVTNRQSVFGTRFPVYVNEINNNKQWPLIDGFIAEAVSSAQSRQHQIFSGRTVYYMNASTILGRQSIVGRTYLNELTP